LDSGLGVFGADARDGLGQAPLFLLHVLLFREQVFYLRDVLGRFGVSHAPEALRAELGVDEVAVRVQEIGGKLADIGGVRIAVAPPQVPEAHPEMIRDELGHHRPRYAGLLLGRGKPRELPQDLGRPGHRLELRAVALRRLFRRMRQADVVLVVGTQVGSADLAGSHCGTGFLRLACHGAVLLKVRCRHARRARGRGQSNLTSADLPRSTPGCSRLGAQFLKQGG